MVVLSPLDASRPADRPTILIVGAANGMAHARRAAEATGASLVVVPDWRLAVAAVADHAGHAALLIEAEGYAPADLAVHLPPIDDAAATAGLPVVVALDRATIDVVAATMTRSRVELLCDPTLGERIVAITVAIGRLAVPGLADRVREGEAARLQRLNEEVARIAEVLSKLTRRDSDRAAAAVGDHPVVFRQAEGMDDVVIDPAEVRRAIRARRLRDQHFGTGLFEDPAWEILLDLFAAELERAQVSVSSLCIAASVAPTTALRWIAKLTEAGLLERHPDPFDRRRAYIELSTRASRAMRDHVAMLRRAGLPFG